MLNVYQHLQRGHQWKPLHYLGISIGHPFEGPGMCHSSTSKPPQNTTVRVASQNPSRSSLTLLLVNHHSVGEEQDEGGENQGGVHDAVKSGNTRCIGKKNMNRSGTRERGWSSDGPIFGARGPKKKKA